MEQHAPLAELGTGGTAVQPRGAEAAGGVNLSRRWAWPRPRNKIQCNWGILYRRIRIYFLRWAALIFVTAYPRYVVSIGRMTRVGMRRTVPVFQGG
jgi:hypothetical protein